MKNCKNNDVRIVFVVTSGISSNKFLVDQISYFRKKGMAAAIISSSDYGASEICKEKGVPFFSVELSREPSPVKDIKCFFVFLFMLARLNPAVVVYSTPKASLLASIATWILRTPTRIYQVRGIRFETMIGRRRAFYKIVEKIIVFASTNIVCNSQSVKDILNKNKITSPDKNSTVVGAGSSNGVDIELFRPPTSDERNASRKNFGFGDEDFIVGFVGRISPDKGISDLVNTFKNIEIKNKKLLVVGPSEGGNLDALDIEINVGSAVHISYIDNTRPVFWSLDVMLFPSLREGFPNVVLEAAACGVPTIGKSVTGTRDSIIHNVTGWLVEKNDWNKSTNIVHNLFENPDLASEISFSAINHTQKKYDQRIVWKAYYNYFSSFLKDDLEVSSSSPASG